MFCIASKFLLKLTKKITIITACLLVTTVTIFAANKPVLKLNSAVQVALRDNPSLAMINARYNALSQIPDQAGSLADPMLMLNALNVPTDSFDLDQEAMTQMQVGVSQAIPFPGKLSLRKKASEHDAQAAGFLVSEAKQQLIWHVKHTWWQIFFLDRSLNVIATNEELFREFIDVAKKKYEVGKGLQQDVLLAQLELSKLLDQEIKLKSMRRSEAIKLNILMDVSPLNQIVLPKKVDEKISKAKSENQLYQTAKSSRPILFEKKKKISAAGTRLDLAETGYYPDFKIDVMYGNRQGKNPAMAGGGDRSDFLTAKLGVSIPLYASTKQSKEIEQRQYELMQSRYSMQDEYNKVYQEISIALTDYKQAIEQYSLYKSGIIPQARQTVDSMLSGYQVNKVDFLNLIRSQVTLFNYEVQYWKAFTDAKKADAKLVAAIGTGETK